MTTCRAGPADAVADDQVPAIAVPPESLSSSVPLSTVRFRFVFAVRPAICRFHCRPTIERAGDRSAERELAAGDADVGGHIES